MWQYFRHVIPRHVNFVADCQFSQDEEIRLLDFPPSLNKLLHERDIGPLEASPWICQYDVVRTGQNAFEQHSLQYVNDTIGSKVREHISKVDLHARIAFLIREDEAQSFEAR